MPDGFSPPLACESGSPAHPPPPSAVPHAPPAQPGLPPALGPYVSPHPNLGRPARPRRLAWQAAVGGRLFRDAEEHAREASVHDLPNPLIPKTSTDCPSDALFCSFRAYLMGLGKEEVLDLWCVATHLSPLSRSLADQGLGRETGGMRKFASRWQRWSRMGRRRSSVSLLSSERIILQVDVDDLLRSLARSGLL